MKKHILLAAVAAFAFAPAAYAQTSGSGGKEAASEQKVGEKDQMFVTMAASSNMFEIESSELAKEKSKSKDVEEFADMMIKDHGMASRELEKTAEAQDAKVPSKLSAKHAQVIEKLEGMDGADFDRAYIQAQRDAHREAISLHTTYAKSGGNAELTALAEKMLPTLKKHADHLKTVQAGGMAEGQSDMGRASTTTNK